ncbi:Ig-like domain-containing protein [Micromonospora sp. NPDC047740]|uniref:Ig-like domain-containing protein n=1 Tax=Micromonospora sp. NPDC047740 TaxID=3364254 RepID=UPI003722B07D
MSRPGFARAMAAAAVFALSVSAFVTGVVLTLSGPAQAASLGTLTLSQTSGSVTDKPMFLRATTPTPCPKGYGENANLRIGPAGGPYTNLAVALGGGGWDLEPFTIDPNRSFETAAGRVPEDKSKWWVIVDCYSLTEGRHADEFRAPIQVCGSTWTTEATCPSAAQTSTMLTVTPTGTAYAGAPVTLTATVTPAAAGTVLFRRTTGTETADVGSAPVSGGQAVLTTSDLPGPAGAELEKAHKLTATFQPADPNAFLTSTSAPADLTVVPAGSVTVTLKTDKVSPQPPGTALALTAEVKPRVEGEQPATGSVSFVRLPAGGSNGEQAIGSAELAAGAATVTVADLPSGAYDLKAVFTPATGSGWQAAESARTRFVIGTPTQTTTTLAVTPDGPKPQGTELTLTARVTPTDATGSVQFMDGSAALGGAQPVASGVASLKTTQLAAGSHPLKAVFTPQNEVDHSGSTSQAVTYQVTAPGQVDGLEVTDADGNKLGVNPTLSPGQKVTVVARGFAGNETITVTLNDAEPTTVTAADGTARYELTVPADAPDGAARLTLAGAAHRVVFDFTVVGNGDDDGDGDGDGDGNGDGGDGNGDGGTGGGQLPRTGLPLIGIGLTGMALVGAGSGAVVSTRRRRPEPAPVVWPDNENPTD